MKKIIFTVLCVASLLTTPVLAQTNGQTVEAYIESLRAQIATLTAQLNQLLGQQNQNGWCWDFNQNLKRGDSGESIDKLQYALKQNLSDRGDVLSTFFDQYIVENLVKSFQTKYNIPATGYVGPLTRAKLNELYGCHKQIFITPETLAPAKAGETYSAALQVHGLGNAMINWSGNLPAGLKLVPTSAGACPTGALCQPRPPEYRSIVGVVPTAGSYAFTVQAANGTATTTKTYTLVVKEKDGKNNNPVISGISGPTSLKVGETGTWKVTATDPLKGILNYQITWGDEPHQTGALPPEPSADAAAQVSTFTHAYATPGTYSVRVNVIATNSRAAFASLTVNVTNSTQSPIAVLSPNGGETWMASSTEDIKWNWSNAKRTDKVDIYLIPDWSCPPGLACVAMMPEPIILDKNISARATYHWLVASEINSNDITIPLGKYRVQVCPAGKEVWSNVCDSSDKPFSINLPLINDAL